MSKIDVKIKKISDDRYTVKLIDAFVNDLGEMSETELDAFLTVRGLVDRAPEEVVDFINVGDEVTVQIERTLG